MSTPITGCVTDGIFYFKDAPHYHYGLKKTHLLEDLARYEYISTEDISEIHSSTLTADGVSLEIGYGSLYGHDYGGLELFSGKTISLALSDSSPIGNGGVGPTSFLELAMDVKVFEPTREYLTTSTILGQTAIQISYSHVDNIPNCFGLEYDVLQPEYVIELSYPGTKDDNGDFITKLPTEASSFNLIKDSQVVSYSDILDSIITTSPIPFSVSNADELDYLRPDDTIFLNFKINVVPVKTTDDLPTPSTAVFGTAYHITSKLDPLYNTYFIRQSDSTYKVVNELPRTKDSRIKVLLQEVPGQPGDIVQNSTIYIIPVGLFDLGWESSSALSQILLELFDGIPAGSFLTINQLVLELASLGPDNNLIIKDDQVDDFSFQEFQIDNIGGNPINVLSLMNSTATNLPSIKLLNSVGYNFIASRKIFIKDMTRTVKLPELPAKSSAPIVITDLTVTETDPEEIVNVEFKLNQNEIIFNRPNNLVYNPTFIKSGPTSLFHNWDTTGDEEISLLNDTTFTGARCCRLDSNNDYVRQFIPNINPVANLVLSAYALASDSTIKFKIYEFDFDESQETVPDVNLAFNVIDTTPIDVDSSFERICQRFLIDSLFNKDDTKELVSVDTQLSPETTCIIIEIIKASGADPLYIDAVQLEYGYNPGIFNSNNLLGIVEHESSPKGYAPRFLVSPTKNANTNGFMVLEIDDVDILDSYNPSDMLSYSNRKELVAKYASKPWAKLLGLNKCRQVGSFSKHRKIHKGEYFLLPQIAEAKHINFLQAPYITKQAGLFDSVKSSLHYIVIEDKSYINLPNRAIDVSISDVEGSIDNTKKLKSDDNGLVVFETLPIKSEEVINPYKFTSSSNLPIGVPLALVASADLATLLPGFNLDLVASVGDILIGYNEDGTYSEVNKVTGTTATEVNEIDGDVAELVTFSFIFKYTPSVIAPSDFFQFPTNSLYDINTRYSGLGMLSYLSDIDYIKRPLSLYNSNESDVITLTRTSVGAYSHFAYTPTELYPIPNSLKIKDVDSPEIVYSELHHGALSSGTFYLNHDTNELIVANPNVETIEVSFKKSKVFVSNYSKKVLFVHYSVLPKIIGELQELINKSELQNQHLKTYASGIEAVKEAIKAVNSSIYIYPSVDINLYCHASHRNLHTDTKITYRHRTPLI